MQSKKIDLDEVDELVGDYSDLLAQGGWERGRHWTGAKRKPLVYHVCNSLLPDGRWVAHIDELPEVRAIAASRQAALDAVQELTSEVLFERDPDIFRRFALCFSIRDPAIIEEHRIAAP